jgi:hypothetical protein
MCTILACSLQFNFLRADLKSSWMKNTFNNKAHVHTYRINSFKKAFSCSSVSILCWSFWHAINLAFHNQYTRKIVDFNIHFFVGNIQISRMGPGERLG